MGRSTRVRFLLIGMLVMSMLFLPTTVSAQTPSLTLPVPSLIQHLPTPDPNGDTGLYDCSAATLTMVLQTLTQTKKIAPGITDYTTIRRTLRSYSTNMYEGIDLRDVVATTPAFTNHAVTAQIFHTSHTEWQRVITDDLRKGIPVIVYLSDWRFLPNHAGKTSAPHAIVISGITPTAVHYLDSWDGNSYEIPKDVFEQAWAEGSDAFYGVRFTVERQAKHDPGPFMQILQSAQPVS